MNAILGQFPEILKYGATGLSAIVCLFAYLLLKQQSAKARPNKSILQMIKIFMGLAVILAILSLVDAGLRTKMQSEGRLQWKDQPKMRISGTIKNDKTEMPMNNAEIYLLPASGNDFVATTDDRGNFVFNSVPEKIWWMIIVRNINSEGKSSGRGMIDPEKKESTISVFGANIDYTMQPLNKEKTPSR